MTTTTPEASDVLRQPFAGADGAPFVTAALAVALRTLRKFFRTPQLVVVGTVQGAMFLLIWRYVFGGAIATVDVPYVDFLVPGFVTTVMLFAGASTAAGVAEDLEQGFIDRLRSLPIPRMGVLAGRALADTTMLAWTLAVTTAVGFAVGFRLHGSLGAGLAAFGLCILFAFTFTSLFVTLGLFAGSAQAAQGMSLLVFPLVFVSSAYVPADSMPGWLQVFSDHQPITTMVDAVRNLCLGQPAGADVTGALIWCLVLIAGFGSLAGARFRRA